MRPCGKTKPAQRGIHGLDDHRRGVVGVEGGGAGGFQFLGREQLLQPLALLRPLVIPGIENLGQSAPADIADQHALLRRCGAAVVSFDALEQLDGRQVVRHFALSEPEPRQSRIGDAVIVLVAGRLRFARHGGGWSHCGGTVFGRLHGSRGRKLRRCRGIGLAVLRSASGSGLPSKLRGWNRAKEGAQGRFRAGRGSGNRREIEDELLAVVRGGHGGLPAPQKGWLMPAWPRG